MKQAPSQLKQKFWTRKIIKHIFQKLTALSNYCSTTWRRKSLLNYLLWGRDFNKFCCNVGCTSWHHTTKTKHTQSHFRACFQLMAIIIKIPMPLIGFSVRLTVNTMYAISPSFHEVLPWQALQIHKVVYEVVFLDAISENCAQKSSYVNNVYCTLYIILVYISVPSCHMHRSIRFS